MSDGENMSINDEKKLAFEFKKHSVNLYITLATGIIAIGVTFIKDLLGGDVPESSLFWLKASCWGLIICIFSGMVLNHQLTGILDQKASSTKVDITIRANNIGLSSAIQFFSFLASLIFIALFASSSMQPKHVASDFLWVAESTSDSSDLGVFETRSMCIEAINEELYRCKLVKL